ncbi:glycosyltransferase [Portibacter lacus]|uniref:Glycosyltransferase subfamily 4-like N-terminal domain-containing protein n=1 Tax=Portibacter lacus TaxID=1099794 RepID=A0AA37ST84_9BACT|nr:glycosyltransferase [Portibacter lacus]GLR17570.1 hypothetical protein GCM10007940_21850 [Portibacter lacus]
MRIAYIYQEGTNIKKSNIYQACSMVKGFSEFVKVDYYRGMHSIPSIDAEKGINQVKVINLGLNKNEKLSRIIFCLHTILYLFFKRPDKILTRDFAFLYAYSKLPSFLRLNVPIIFEAHKVYHKVSDKVSLKQEMSAYSIVSKFIVVSNGIKHDLMKIFEFAGKNILVAPNGIDNYKFEEIQSAQENNKKNFIYAGSYGEWKGVDVILEASNLLENFKGHIYLVGIEEHLPNYNSEVITVLPPMEKPALYKFYQKMDVGIVPTLNHLEGTLYTSPIKFFEYAYADLVILASDIPSIRELENLKFEIHFFDVGSPISLAKNLEAISNSNIDKKSTDDNKELVLQYTWNKRAETILNFINSN